MRGVNMVVLMGFVGQDPEVRYTGSGSAVVNLSLATDDSYKDRNTGQMVQQTDWHRIVIFGKTAEVASQYLRKGSGVYIKGKQKTRKWQDQSGQDRYTTEVVVDIAGEMQMLPSGGNANQGQGSQPRNNGAASNAGNQGGSSPEPAPEPAGGMDDDDWNPDKIPF